MSDIRELERQRNDLRIVYKNLTDAAVSVARAAKYGGAKYTGVHESHRALSHTIAQVAADMDEITDQLAAWKQYEEKAE